MTTNGLAFVSTCFALRLTLNFFIVYTATNVDAGSNDYLKSSQSHKDLGAVSERRNDTSWLPYFKSTTSPPKESSRPRKRPKWETSESQDEDRPELQDIADEKSELRKQMEEISRAKREKWKKYQTEKTDSFDTGKIQSTVMKNFDKKMRKNLTNTSHITVSKINEEDQLHVLKKRSEYKLAKEEDKGQDFFPSNETENGRLKKGGKKKPDLRLISRKFQKSKNVKGPEKVKLESSRISYHILNRIKFSEKNNQTRKFENEKSKKLENPVSGRRFGDRLRNIDSNGRWGMSGGNEPPSEIRDEIFRRRIMENNGEKESRRLLKDIDKRIIDSPAEKSREDIRTGKWGISERKPAEKFCANISNDKNIREIETLGKHSGLLESGGVKKKPTEVRNFIKNSKNEHRINDVPKTSQGTIEHTRRTLNTQDSPKSLKNNQKFHEPNSPPGIRRLIEIIISPYDVAAASSRNGIELSIDQLIEEGNGLSSVRKLQPIVIGLSSGVSDKRG